MTEHSDRYHGPEGPTTYVHVMYSNDGATFTPEELDEQGHVIHAVGKTPRSLYGTICRPNRSR